MKSREAIINKLNDLNAYAEVELPSLQEIGNRSTIYSLDHFKQALTQLQAKHQTFENRADLDHYLNTIQSSDPSMVNILEDSSMEIQSPYNTRHFVAEGLFGVLENGAIWVSPENKSQRLTLFSCEVLVIVLKESELVNDMHQAYKQLVGRDWNYGVFISGPSKTADIEQSLVIGAHGPCNLQVLLYRD